MEEPSPRSSRQAIAGAVAAAIVVGAFGFLLGRGSAPPAQPAPPPPVAEPVPAAAAPALPTPTPPLGRAQLLALASMASDAAASRTAEPDTVLAASGRRFILYLPFGCDGPAVDGSASPLSWQHDAEKGVLRLRVRPAAWSAADWWPASAAPGAAAAIEGFWIPRPWSSAESCVVAGSAMAPGSEPLTLPGQTLAIAQFLGPESPRHLLRDGRPLEADLRTGEDFTPPAGGFRLRLTGRINRVPGGGPIRCIQPAGAEQRPICVVAAAFEEAAIENPETRETLASWLVGG